MAAAASPLAPLYQLATGGLEGYVYELLSRHLARWIHLSREQLNVSAWHGEGVLEDVSVRTDALRSLALPLRVRSGRAARIRLRIPWHALRCAPPPPARPRARAPPDPPRLAEAAHRPERSPVERVASPPTRAPHPRRPQPRASRSPSRG